MLDVTVNAKPAPGEDEPAEDIEQASICSRCNGNKEIAVYSYTWGSDTKPCPDCDGRSDCEPEDYLDADSE